MQFPKKLGRWAGNVSERVAETVALRILLKFVASAAVGGAVATAGPAVLSSSPAPHKGAVVAQVASQAAMGSVHPPGWGRAQIAAAREPARAGTQTAEMFDAISASAVAGLPIVALAGYVDGNPLWRTYFPFTQLYPRAIVRSIAVFSSDRAMCGDFEPGDMSPAQVVAWYHADVAAGFRKPCVYSSLWEWGQIRPLLDRAGIPRSSYWAWDANYYGSTPRLDAGFDCTQWTSASHGRNLDESTCTYGFLGIVPKPKPKPKPVRQICFGKHPMHTPGCVVVQHEVAAWRKQAAADLANAARVVKRWS